MADLTDAMLLEKLAAFRATFGYSPTTREVALRCERSLDRTRDRLWALVHSPANGRAYRLVPIQMGSNAPQISWYYIKIEEQTE